MEIVVDEDIVDDVIKTIVKLRDIMEKAFYEVYGFSVKRKLDMRNAALALAVGRVAEAMRLRGVYP